MDADFEADGIPFSYIVAMTSGTDAGLAGQDDAEYWADDTGIGHTMPIFADLPARITQLLPTSITPAWCALTPRMELLQCWSGHNPGQDASLDPLIDVIRTDWAEHGG